MNTPSEHHKHQLGILVDSFQASIEAIKRLGYPDAFIRDNSTSIPTRFSPALVAWKTEVEKRLAELRDITKADKPIHELAHALRAIDVNTINVTSEKFAAVKPDLIRLLTSAIAMASEPRSSLTSPPLAWVGGDKAITRTPLKIFVTHGKNLRMLELAKEAIRIAGHQPMVAIDIVQTARPISEKVLNLMRQCDGAIVCVSNDDPEKKAAQLNSNVLIEIGAALALYPTKFVLIWEKGLAPPSNLQGLERFEVSGDDMKLEDGFRLIRLLQEASKWAEIPED